MEDNNTITEVTDESVMETTSLQSTVDSEPNDETKLQGVLNHSYNLEDLRSRLLHPSQYISSLQELEKKVYDNGVFSRTQHHPQMPSIQFPTVPSELERVIPNRLSHDPLARDPTNTSDDEITMQSNFCAGSFSVLVLDRTRLDVATLLPIESTDFIGLVYELEYILRDAASLVINSSGSEIPPSINTRWDFLNTPSVKQYCQSILQINPGNSQDYEPVSVLGVVDTLLALVLALDFAVVSYAGAHCSSNLGGPTDYDLIDIFEPLRGETNRPMDTFFFRRCKLQCLDAFHSGKGVLVFCPPSCNPLSPLYISATISSFSDIWGPVWKLRDQNDPGRYTAYVVGNGYIIPWKHDERTPDKLEEERFCHWVSDEEQEDGALDTRNLTYNLFDGTERLLIGAPTDAPIITPPTPWIANPRCSILVSEARRRLQETKRLCIVGASRPYHYNDSNQYQLQVGYAGVNATITRNYKRAAGQNLKEILIQLWALEPDLRDPKLLEDLHGVEISMCTSNAQRVSISHLLRLQCMHHLLRDFAWEEPSYRDEYLLTLEDTRRPTRLRDARFKKKFDDAVMLGLKMLSKTGVDRSDNLCVFLSSPCAAMPELATMLPKEHSWIGMLKDTTTECTLAAFGDTCLEFKYHKGISCGGAGHSALRSSMILHPSDDRMFSSIGDVIDLGERGELCFKSNVGGVLVMEWSYPYFKMAIRSKFNKELVYRELTGIDHSTGGKEVQTATIFIVSKRPRGGM
ncbi:hypothetical protein V494_06562 [Pseudogymnoascus sp. VKM F-4513 (FW-928)]|nr:hypothetical protein V494_06562 [Pseudogymnoascus sp. VKM F-4513 (FW-928)]